MGITASDRWSGEAPGRDSPLREELEAEGWTESSQHLGILVLGQGVRDPSAPKMFEMEGIGCHHHRRAEGQGARTLNSLHLTVSCRGKRAKEWTAPSFCNLFPSNNQSSRMDHLVSRELRAQHQ